MSQLQLKDVSLNFELKGKGGRCSVVSEQTAEENCGGSYA